MICVGNVCCYIIYVIMKYLLKIYRYRCSDKLEKIWIMFCVNGFF